MQFLCKPLWVGVLMLGLYLAYAPTYRDSDWLVRVGLEHSAWADTLYVSISSGTLRWVDPSTGITLGIGTPNQVWMLRYIDGQFRAQSDRLSISAQRLAAEPSDGGFVMVSTAPNTLRRYRGHLEWTIRDGKLLTINWVALDDYLKATLPREMPPNFHPEALKAQAVAARSFTFSRLNRYRQWGYDLCDHAPCQVYGGVDAEHPATNAAVEATAGEVLRYNGRVLEAVYTSNCGGHTAPIEVAMLGTRPLPPLRGVPDTDPTGKPYCALASNYAWETFLSVAELSQRFPEVGQIRELQVVQRASSGHVALIRLRGARGERTLTGAEFRLKLGATRIRNLQFELHSEGMGWKLTGRGSGHGAGLCQWGAHGRALAGQSYRQILQAYYPGATLVSLHILQTRARP